MPGGSFVCFFASGAIFTVNMMAASLMLVDQDIPLSIVDASHLLAWYMFGATGGTTLSLAIFTPGKDTQVKDTQVNVDRRYWIKITASLFSGVCLSPMLIDYFQVPARPSYACGVATCFACFTVACLHQVVPIAERFIPYIFEALLRKFCKTFGLELPDALKSKPEVPEVIPIKVSEQEKGNN